MWGIGMHTAAIEPWPGVQVCTERQKGMVVMGSIIIVLC